MAITVIEVGSARVEHYNVFNFDDLAIIPVGMGLAGQISAVAVVCSFVFLINGVAS